MAKNLICLMLVLTFVLLCFAGCSSEKQPSDTNAEKPSSQSTVGSEEDTNYGSKDDSENKTPDSEKEPAEDTSKEENSNEEKTEEVVLASIELLADSFYVVGDEPTLTLNITMTDKTQKTVPITDDMLLTSIDWDTPGIYNTIVKYQDKTLESDIIIIEAEENCSSLVTVDGKKLMNSDTVANDGTYNQYVDYTDISKFDAVRIKCSLWHSPEATRHTAIILYDESKNPIAVYDALNLCYYGVKVPKVTGGCSYNVDVSLQTFGAKYVRFSNKTNTGSDDLNGSGYTLVEPSLTGYKFGFEPTQMELLNSSTGKLGTYANGGASYGKYFFQFCDKLDTIYIKDLDTNTVIDTHDFAEKKDTYHCNSVTFGGERYSPDDEFPLIYVSMENTAEHKALVYRVTRSGNDFSFALVQTISYPIDVFAGMFYQNCVIDGENGYMYICGYINRNWQSDDGTNGLLLKRYKLPTLADGEAVALDENDALYTLRLPFAVATQGAFIRNGKLIQVYGINSSAKLLRVIDLSLMRLVYELDLATIGLDYEPESICYYDGYYYLTDVNDNFYKFKLS